MFRNAKEIFFERECFKSSLSKLILSKSQLIIYFNNFDDSAELVSRYLHPQRTFLATSSTFAMQYQSPYTGKHPVLHLIF